ncbi:uncharacterized protein LOC144744390 [Ciona intestinalis]
MSFGSSTSSMNLSVLNSTQQEFVNSTDEATATQDPTTVHDHFEQHLIHPGITVLIASCIMVLALLVYMQLRGIMWRRMTGPKPFTPQQISKAVLEQIEREIKLIESKPRKTRSGNFVFTDIHADSSKIVDGTLAFSSKDSFVKEGVESAQRKQETEVFIPMSLLAPPTVK